MPPRKKETMESDTPEGTGSHLISQAILSLVGQVPSSKERKSQTPADDARAGYDDRSLARRSASEIVGHVTRRASLHAGDGVGEHTAHACRGRHSGVPP